MEDERRIIVPHAGMPPPAEAGCAGITAAPVCALLLHEAIVRALERKRGFDRNPPAPLQRELLTLAGKLELPLSLTDALAFQHRPYLE